MGDRTRDYVPVMSEVAAQFRALFRGGSEALVYTMRDLNQRLSHIMSEIETTGKSAFITKRGRFVAVITPLAPGQVEARVLDEMAREIGNTAGG